MIYNKDFVIVKLQRSIPYKSYEKIIGQVTEKVGHHQYQIKYPKNIIYVYEHEILINSKNKTDCELYIKNPKLYKDSIKYNL